MKICFLAPIHNIKNLCSYLVNHGHQVYVISFVPGNIEKCDVYYIDNTIVSRNNCDLIKLKYIIYVNKIYKIIKSIEPDIVHVHYATSNGIIASLSKLNYILTVWGADIYKFPRKSLLHRYMIKRVLRRAEYISSISVSLAEEAQKYTDKDIKIMPFGVDTVLFSPQQYKKKADEFVIGTTSDITCRDSLDTIIKALSLCRKSLPDADFSVHIIGQKHDSRKLNQISSDLDFGDNITWTNCSCQRQVAEEWKIIDVAVILPHVESFGSVIRVLEAQSSGIPVIVSGVPGLIESTIPGETSIVVSKNNENLLAEAIIKLYENDKLRISMGKNGRDFTLKNYEYNSCFSQIEEFYGTII